MSKISKSSSSAKVGNYGGFELISDDVLTAARHLSPFQVEKFTFLFDTFLDIEKNGLIEKNDITAFLEKLRTYRGWKKDSKKYLELIDVGSTFYECICDQVKAEFQAAGTTEDEAMISWEDAFDRYSDAKMSKTMNIIQWLNMWGRLCYGSAGISDFPIWVQILPDIFFSVIDRDQDGLLSFDEMKNFYRDLVEIKNPAQLEKVCKEGYRAMTANGDYELNKGNYDFVFANFLLGKDIYGPGKYLFGVFDNREIDETFPVKYNDEEE